MPVHFLDLASAVEKLRWAEKEWRELDNQKQAADQAAQNQERAAEEEIRDPVPVGDQLKEA